MGHQQCSSSVAVASGPCRLRVLPRAPAAQQEQCACGALQGMPERVPQRSPPAAACAAADSISPPLICRLCRGTYQPGLTTIAALGSADAPCPAGFAASTK